MNLGEVKQYRGQLREAEANFTEGLKIHKNIKVPTSRPKNLLGMLYLEQGNIEKAEPFIIEAGYSGSTGRLFLIKKDHTKAKESYENLLKSAEKNRNADAFFTAHTGLGIVWEEMGDNARAAEHYSKAVDYTEDLRASISPSARESFFDVKVEGFIRTEPYKGLARVLVKMKRPGEALRQSEACRARIFAETLSRRSFGLSSDVPKDVMVQDDLLNNQIAALTKNLQAAYEKWNKLTIYALEPQIKELKAKHATHVAMLRKQYPLFAATKYPQPMGLEQSALKDDEWVIAYDLTDSGILIYLTKGKYIVKTLFRPVSREEVDVLVRKFRDSMELTPEESLACAKQGLKQSVCLMRKISTFDFASSKKLADLLLGDILSDLPKDTPVIIVPDGSLGVVPF